MALDSRDSGHSTRGGPKRRKASVTGRPRFIACAARAWRGYSPFYSSWEPASQVNAPRIVEKYEADLKRQRDYLDGIVHELDDEGESVRLDPEVYNSVDAIVCAQLCEMDEKWQDWVASKWLDRTYSTVPKGDES